MESVKNTEKRQAHELDSSYAEYYATKEVPVVDAKCTIGQTIKLIRSRINDFDSLDYIYVAEGGKLIGVFSIRKLYLHKPGMPVRNILGNVHLVTVFRRDRAIHAAYLALKHKISSIPVTDEDGFLLGVITKDKILSILHSKHIEDRFFQAGIHRKHAQFDDGMNTPVLQSVRFRILWLIIGMAGGLVAAQIVNSFAQTLEKNIILAAFMPLVVYIADAVGTQLEAFSIRDFAVHIRLRFLKYFLRQSLIVLIISLLLGAISTAFCAIIYGSMKIAITVGISITFAAFSSVSTGLIIPFLMKKFKRDPAAGSGPIGTIIQDIMSVFIYFLVASLIV